MALTRRFLSALGIEAEKVDEIITAHTESINALKEDRDKYKVDAERLPEIQKELDDLKASVNDNSEEVWKKKYEDEHNAFEGYKKDIVEKEAIRSVKEAYKELLKSNNIDESRISAILKVTDFKEMKLNEDGKFENETKLIEGINSEWAGFKKSTGSSGADVDNPPGNGDTMTKEAFEKMPLSERMEYANSHPGEASEFLK